MTERTVAFDVFTLERTYKYPIAKVYAAFADQKAKDKWFGGPPGQWTLLERSFDFRPGGKELASGRFEAGWVSRFDATYYEIIPNERIIYSYEMHIDGKRISVSLATVEFQAAGAGTKLTVTEQGVFLDGYKDGGSREQGTSFLLDQLGASLEMADA